MQCAKLERRLMFHHFCDFLIYLSWEPPAKFHNKLSNQWNRANDKNKSIAWKSRIHKLYTGLLVFFFSFIKETLFPANRKMFFNIEIWYDYLQEKKNRLPAACNLRLLVIVLSNGKKIVMKEAWRISYWIQNKKRSRWVKKISIE